MGLTSAGDGELVARATAGDGDAFRQLFDRHRDRVAAACRQRLRCASDVDDAVQEAFARALDKLPQLKDADRFGSWVTTIAIRVCNDHHRAARRTVLLDLGVDGQTELEDSGPGPDELIEAAEHSASVLATLAALGERDREALLLRHVADAPVSVVASRLGLTEGSTRVLLTRARHRLRAATASLPVLVPVSWRQWLREHLPASSPALEAMAVVMALTVVAGTFAGAPHPSPAQAAEQRPSVAAEEIAPSTRPARRAATDRPGTASRPSRPAAPRTAAEAPRAAAPPRSPVAAVSKKVQVRNEYPRDHQTQEIADVTIFTGEEEAEFRLYADEITDAVRDARNAVPTSRGD